MQEAVEECSGEPLAAENLGPLLEGQIGGDDEERSVGISGQSGVTSGTGDEDGELVGAGVSAKDEAQLDTPWAQGATADTQGDLVGVTGRS